MTVITRRDRLLVVEGWPGDAKKSVVCLSCKCKFEVKVHTNRAENLNISNMFVHAALVIKDLELLPAVTGPVGVVAGAEYPIRLCQLLCEKALRLCSPSDQQYPSPQLTARFTSPTLTVVQTKLTL